MTVYITEISIRNYRSCINTTLQLSPYTALVGRNNCGKSNCLTALQWLVRKATLDVEDFHDAEQPVEVIGEFEDITEADLDLLEPAHRTRIAPLVVAGKLSLRRFQEVPGTAGALTVRDPNTASWVALPTGIENSIKTLFPEPIRIGAMENAEEDASKAKTTTTIGKLLASMLESIKGLHEAELLPFIGEITTRLTAGGAQRFEELGRIDTSINNKIGDLFPGMSIKLDFPIPQLIDLIKGGTVRVYEGEGGGRPFGSYGHGAQRAIQMAMVRHLAEVKRGAAGVGGATLLLVDEPELFMHPFAIEQVREALRALSKSGYQVIFSTHSAQMVSSQDAHNALLMRKDAAAGTTARPKIRALVEQLVSDPTHQLLHLFSLTNSSQLLFADKVVLTEGKTELRLLPGVYEEIAGTTLGQSSLALIALGGATNTKKSMQILDALGLPSCVIVDLDFAFRHAVASDLLASDDQDIAACKAILAGMAATGRIYLNAENGLPEKQNGISAAKAFELMAAEPSAGVHVSALVGKLRAQRVWLWSRGTIEPHLGLMGKNEDVWLAFQMRCSQDGIDQVAADAPAVRELVAWLAT